MITNVGLACIPCGKEEYHFKLTLESEDETESKFVSVRNLNKETISSVLRLFSDYLDVEHKFESSK